jgi:hypothetical protein
VKISVAWKFQVPRCQKRSAAPRIVRPTRRRVAVA